MHEFLFHAYFNIPYLPLSIYIYIYFIYFTVPGLRQFLHSPGLPHLPGEKGLPGMHRFLFSKSFLLLISK